MLAMGGAWMLLWGSWMVISLVRQVRELRTFTETVAAPVTPRAATAQEIEALRTRIGAFAAAVEANQAAVLQLSADDLNTLLASDPRVAGMKENVLVEAVTDTAVRLRISLAMNGMPLTGERLFLNGFCEVKPTAHPDKGILLATSSLSVPDRTLTEGFISHYTQANHVDALLLNGIRETTDLRPLNILKQVTTVRMENGQVILDYAPPAPKATPPAAPASPPAAP